MSFILNTQVEDDTCSVLHNTANKVDLVLPFVAQECQPNLVVWHSVSRLATASWCCGAKLPTD